MVECIESCLVGQHVASPLLFSIPHICIVLQRCPFHSRSLISETPRDSKIVFLHWGLALVVWHPSWHTTKTRSCCILLQACLSLITKVKSCSSHTSSCLGCRVAPTRTLNCPKDMVFDPCKNPGGIKYLSCHLLACVDAHCISYAQLPVLHAYTAAQHAVVNTQQLLSSW